MAAQSNSEHDLLKHAIEADLNRLRILAREMCPVDAAKLETAVGKAFDDLLQIQAVIRDTPRDEVH